MVVVVMFVSVKGQCALCAGTKERAIFRGSGNLIGRALAKDPANRFQTMTGMGRALERERRRGQRGRSIRQWVASLAATWTGALSDSP